MMSDTPTPTPKPKRHQWQQIVGDSGAERCVVCGARRYDMGRYYRKDNQSYRTAPPCEPPAPKPKTEE